MGLNAGLHVGLKVGLQVGCRCLILEVIVFWGILVSGGKYFFRNQTVFSTPCSMVHVPPEKIYVFCFDFPWLTFHHWCRICTKIWNLQDHGMSPGITYSMTTSRINQHGAVLTAANDSFDSFFFLAANQEASQFMRFWPLGFGPLNWNSNLLHVQIMSNNRSNKNTI